ncbi:hypothetical protein [Rhodanobacter sp. OR87]|nr:hypothetical protein [Rhodanobacter sp. OR87]
MPAPKPPIRGRGVAAHRVQTEGRMGLRQRRQPLAEHLFPRTAHAVVEVYATPGLRGETPAQHAQRGVIPMPPAISTTGTSRPGSSTKRPAGAFTLSTSPTCTASWKWFATFPAGSSGRPEPACA